MALATLAMLAGTAGPARGDSLNVLTLLDGKELIGTVLNEQFAIQTPYAMLTLKRADVGSVLLDPTGQGIEGLVLRNEDRVSGFVVTPELDFRERSGAIVHLRKEKVKNIALRVPSGQASPGLHRFRFRNGDVLTGRLDDRKLVVLSAYGTVEIRSADVTKVEIFGDVETRMRLTLTGGKRVEGRLRDEDVTLSLEVGGTLKVYLGNLEEISGTDGRRSNDPASGGDLDGMIYVEGGDFTMGSDDGEEDERPSRRVFVASFFLDRREVSNDEYLRFVQATGHRAPKGWRGGTYPSGTGERPVVYVNFQDASDFARWAGKRLPSEEEWEKAARGLDGRRYPWGDGFEPGRANCRETGLGRSASPGSFKGGESPYGLFDMAGNVWEWTDSWYQIRKSKVFKGGSFRDSAQKLRCSYRSSFNPNLEADDLGFRCARSARGR
jgi:hypothetical protein